MILQRRLKGLVFAVAWVLLCLSSAMASEEVVLILPVKAAAFTEIETGIRSVLADRVPLRVILASDFQGKPGGVVEAALANNPQVVVPLGTTLSQAFDPDPIN